MQLKLKGYIKPKKNSKKDQFQEFDKTVQELKLMIKATKRSQNNNEVVNILADNKEADGKNILHLAA